MPGIEDPDDAALGGGVGSEVDAVTETHQRLVASSPTTGIRLCSRTCPALGQLCTASASGAGAASTTNRPGQSRAIVREG